MQAVVVEEIGSFVLKEMQVPEPGPGEALIKVEVTGLCRTDLKIIENGHRDLVLPRVPGEEVVGTGSLWCDDPASATHPRAIRGMGTGGHRAGFGRTLLGREPGTPGNGGRGHRILPRLFFSTSAPQVFSSGGLCLICVNQRNLRINSFVGATTENPDMSGTIVAAASWLCRLGSW